NETIFFAQKNIVQYIYNSAKLEGINITFDEVKGIYNKTIVKNISIYDINTIINLKHAWDFIINTLDAEDDLNYLCKIHNEVAKNEALEWGKLRAGNVGISGTYYKPPIPTEESINGIIMTSKSYESITEKSIDIMIKLMKAQPFWDGNKRTSMMFANKEMIRNGKGVISIPEEKIIDFNRYLSDYYSNNTIEHLKDFIYKNCIDGISM
uniref:Fic family protein n=1 Tax=Anaerococcus sp. AGMB09787 TaxID=2922869 RepID=UPI001FB00B2E